MEFFYSSRGVASIVHWDCLVYIYIYGRLLCGFDNCVLLVLSSSVLDKVGFVCTSCDQLVCK